MIVSAIAAMTKNRVIGKNNQIPWYLPADLKYFKKTTINHHVIMGRKCFESVGKPLPKRTNIILTRNPYYVGNGIITTNSKQEALEIAHANGEEEVFILGGGEIYDMYMTDVDKIYLTILDTELDGDVFFPEFDLTEWNLESEEKHQADDRNPYDYTFLVYTRKH